VKNNYLRLDPNTKATASELQITSSGRFDRACELVGEKPLQSPEDCFSLLSDPAVRMEITLQ